MTVYKAAEPDATRARPTSSSDFSVHMDAVRGLMALLVFFEHGRLLFFVDYGANKIPGMLIKICYFMAGMGNIAVMVFFVLSGFFIGSSVLKAIRSGFWSFKWYAVQRLTRLLVVLIPALLLGASLDMAGMAIFGKAGAYAGGHQYYYIIKAPVALTLSLRIALENLLFLQWIKAPCLGSNGPLWSLSFEFWYYVAFPLFALSLLGRFKWTTRLLLAALGLGVLMFVGNNIASYFAIWLMGALVAALPMRRHSFSRAALVFCLAAFLVAVGVVRWKYLMFWGDFTVAAFFAGFMYFLRDLTNDSLGCGPAYRRMATFISGISYSLYLLHVPALFFFNALLVGPGLRWQMDSHHALITLLVMAATFIYVLAVWSVTEAKTSNVRNFVHARVVRAKV